MIVSKTPLRMSYVGGGSDLPAFYRDELGAVLSTAIDRYVYISVNRKFDGRIRLSYSKTEEVDAVRELEHPIVREAMQLLSVSGVEVASTADIPSKGSGLGSSSSFTVGLLNALYAYKNSYASKELLARQACHVEIDKCGEPIGKQDQYAASYGGLNLIRFHPNEDVSVDPIICKPELLNKLDQSTLIFYTGRTRSASEVLLRQNMALAESNKKYIMRRMVNLAFDMKADLESNTLDNFGEMLHENWKLKVQLSKGITDSQIDDWYTTGLKHGATGGKLLGAGNGGFIMFFAHPEKHSAIVEAMNGLQMVKFSMDRNGSQIVFYQPSN